LPSESTTPLYVQMPFWPLVWAGLAAPHVWRDPRLRPAFIGFGSVFLLFLALILYPETWHLVPVLYWNLQFSYRLVTYLTLCTVAFVMLGVLALDGGRTGLAPSRLGDFNSGLVACVVLSVALAAWQLSTQAGFDYVNYANRGDVITQTRLDHTPTSWYAFHDYTDYALPVVAVAAGRTYAFQPTSVRDDGFAGMVHLPAGEGPIATNVASATAMVKVSGGVRAVGRNDAGDLVIERTEPSAGPVEVRLSAAGTAIAAGRGLTLVAALALGLLALATLARGVLRRRAGAGSAPRAS
jgi:hypothetical protein